MCICVVFLNARVFLALKTDFGEQLQFLHKIMDLVDVVNETSFLTFISYGHVKV
jgi:hypothetical protein